MIIRKMYKPAAKSSVLMIFKKLLANLISLTSLPSKKEIIALSSFENEVEFNVILSVERLG